MTGTATARPTHPRWLLPLIGGLIVCLVLASNTGNAVWASWVESHPLGLIALNASNKYLVATSINNAFWPFLVVGVVRLMLPDPLFWAIGHLYGPRALHWARDVFPGSRSLLEQVGSGEENTTVTRTLHVLLVIMPNNVVCLVAGAARITLRRMLLLSFVGTVGRVLLMWWIGHLFEDQIEDVLDVVSRYQRWFLIGSIALVVAYVAWQAVGRRGLVGGLEELEEELGDE